jgi:hypothetical protein
MKDKLNGDNKNADFNDDDLDAIKKVMTGKKKLVQLTSC